MRTQELLEARGVSAELASDLGLETAIVPRALGGADGTWVAIPFKVKGIVQRWAYRRVFKDEDADTNFAQDKGGVGEWFWNQDVLTDPGYERLPLVVCEGVFDAMVAIAAGYPRAVSVPNGSPEAELGAAGGPARYKFVANNMDALANVTEIILAVDDDPAGHALLADLAVRIDKARCKWVKYPAGTKDLLDVRALDELDALDGLPCQRRVGATLADARWMHVPGLYRMSELPPEPVREALVSGVPGMEGHYNIRRGDFTLITGIPSMGKSTWANTVSCSMAEKYGWTTAFASFEQNPQDDHRRALRQWFTQKPEHHHTAHELEAADAWIERHFAFVMAPDDQDATLEWILKTMAAAILRYAVDMIVIDPWNELEHTRGRDQTESEYVGSVIRVMKRFARKWGVHFALVAHPTKISKAADGQYPMPTAYDVSGCYSDDTEVLTRRGWLRHARVTTEDVIMCFDPADGSLGWHNPQQVIHHDFKGDMLNFKGYGYDLLVSPNHRMVVKPAWIEPTGTQALTGRGRPVRWPKDVWSFAEARDFLRARGAFRIPKAGSAPLPGPELPDLFHIGAAAYPTLDFLELVGWWIAEGSVAGSGLSLCQAVGPGADRIDLLLATCGLEPYRAVREDPRGYLPMVTWYFGARNYPDLVDWLPVHAGWGTAGKRIPPVVFDMHPAAKAALLNGYIAGDGSRPSLLGSRASTTSPGLVDDLQRLAVELALPVSSSPKACKPAQHYLDSWQLNFGTDARAEVTMRPARNLHPVPYQGLIWCLTVPTGAYVTRRNGKVSICGNSANWFNKPEVVVVVHRDAYGTHVRVAKSRYHDSIGTPVTVDLNYDALWTGRYTLLGHTPNPGDPDTAR